MASIPAGEYPFTSGIYPEMYRRQLWTMRQYAGYGGAAEANQRFRQLLAAGTTGLSVAFDLPTQMGYDSDHELAAGEVGRVGVAIDTLSDLRRLFADIPLADVTTSMTINSPAAVLLAMYELLAEEQGADLGRLGGTVQNDVLKEYIARGTYIFPPSASMRLTTDVFEYCQQRLPRWNSISISGYHMAEAGATAAQEVAFTLANAVAYVQTAIDRGLKVDDFAPRLAFFFVARTELLHEVAKFRAARTVWAEIMRNRFGAQDPRSQMLRFHTQTAGVELTAQQPEVNLVRVALQALGAVLGGTQSLHTNSFDEALALPSEKAATLALRTQQVIGYETDVPAFVDPFAGSTVVEELTGDIAGQVRELMAEIEAMGGAVAAIAAGHQQAAIERSAYATAQEIESGRKVVVGLNRFQTNEPLDVEFLRVDPEVEAAQVASLRQRKAARDQAAVAAALAELAKAAAGNENTMPAIKAAVRVEASVGEVCDTLRQVWGTHDRGPGF